MSKKKENVSLIGQQLSEHPGTDGRTIYYVYEYDGDKFVVMYRVKGYPMDGFEEVFEKFKEADDRAVKEANKHATGGKTTNMKNQFPGYSEGVKEKLLGTEHPKWFNIIPPSEVTDASIKEKQIYALDLRDDSEFLIEEGEDIQGLKDSDDFAFGIEKKKSHAEGGKVRGIQNQYEGETAEQVWKEWSPEQRKHFISDLHGIYETTDDGHNDSRDEAMARHSFKILLETFPPIAAELEKHVKRGQYAEGGSVHADKIKELEGKKRDIERALESKATPEPAKAKLRDKLESVEAQLEELRKAPPPPARRREERPKAEPKKEEKPKEEKKGKEKKVIEYKGKIITEGEAQILQGGYRGVLRK